MEVRESSGPRAAGAPSMQAGPGSFGAYYHRGASFPPGAPLMASPPSGIHAPAAMRHTPSPQPIAVAAAPAAPNSPPSFPPDGATPMISQQMGVSQAPPMGVGMGMGMGMGIGMGMPRTEPVKRKRGRPRKYGTDVNGVALGLTPISSGTGTPREKKARSSGKKAQLNALGAAGQSFTPHVITVAAGEDVAMKIMSFSQRGPWAICILSANGAISNVTLRQPSISGGSVTYEGRFEILSLSGSFLLTESGGTRSRTGGLSVSLAGPDGRVVGGGVAGLLMAASPVQVVVGTFLPESRKSQQARAGVSDIPPGMHNTGTATGTSPLGPMAQPARADASGSLHDHRSRSLGGDIQQQAHVAHVMPLQSMDWTGAQFNPEARVGTDNMGSSPGGS